MIRHIIYLGKLITLILFSHFNLVHLLLFYFISFSLLSRLFSFVLFLLPNRRLLFESLVEEFFCVPFCVHSLAGYIFF